jgi:hypothetical protein
MIGRMCAANRPMARSTPALPREPRVAILRAAKPVEPKSLVARAAASNRLPRQRRLARPPFLGTSVASNPAPPAPANSRDRRLA